MFLDRIVATKQQEVAQLAESFALAEAERAISALPPTRGFARALRNSRRPGMGLIAEVKKASPSKGLIRADFEPAALAQAYEAAGADCISVLTDREYFQGCNDYLTRVREAVRIPLLRKDFTIDPRQIYEARLVGADAILLIAAILTTAQMRDYLKLAAELGLDALVEVHDRDELERALELDVELIGINNRNLKTFVTDIRTTEELIGCIPAGKTIVSESGIGTNAEIEYLRSVGANAVLVGESLMRKPDVGEAVHELMGRLTGSASQAEVGGQ